VERAKGGGRPGRAAEEVDENGFPAQDVLVDQDGHDLPVAEGLEDFLRRLLFVDDPGAHALPEPQEGPVETRVVQGARDDAERPGLRDDRRADLPVADMGREGEDALAPGDRACQVLPAFDVDQLLEIRRAPVE
jgi:hypothetical protein